MKDNEVIAGHLSPCVRIFIDSLLNGESTTNVSQNTGGTDISRDIKEDPDGPSGLKREIRAREYGKEHLFNPAPLQSLNDEQEGHARRTFAEPW